MTKGIAERLLYFTVARIYTNPPNIASQRIRNTSAMEAVTSSSGMVINNKGLFQPLQ